MLKYFLQSMIVILSLEYVIVFSAEVILPGVVTDVFNINILLVALLILLGVLVFLVRRNSYACYEICKDRESGRGSKLFLTMGIVMMMINMIALYKVSVVMILVYSIIIMGIVMLLWSQE